MIALLLLLVCGIVAVAEVLAGADWYSIVYSVIVIASVLLYKKNQLWSLGTLVALEGITLIKNWVNVGSFIEAVNKSGIELTVTLLAMIVYLVYWNRKGTEALSKLNKLNGYNRFIFYGLVVSSALGISNLFRVDGYPLSFLYSLYALLPLVIAVAYMVRTIDVLVFRWIQAAIALEMCYQQIVDGQLNKEALILNCAILAISSYKIIVEKEKRV